MRTPFCPPSVHEFEKLFSIQTGGGLDDIRIYSPYNRSLKGGGILSFLAGLAKRAFPFLLNTVAPEGVSMAQNIMQDVNSGKQNIRQALKTRGLEALRNVGRKIARGGKKVKRLQKKKKKQKKCFNDVFSSI